jgi:dTDP-glucose 4,6-dehydratase
MLVTGGAGFIGCNFVRHIMRQHPDLYVVNLDLLTYAGSLSNLRGAELGELYHFIQADIADYDTVRRVIEEHRVDTIVHFAAESHVDRSITAPDRFIQTNIIGTFNLLRSAQAAWKEWDSPCRFLHVSTDEVYGTLQPDDPAFSEKTPYAPNSPYAASKASADHLVRAYHETYGFPAITTNCSNNYGPFQYPEKLIPLMIINALTGKGLPIYGDGMQIRDWLYVGDHCEALWQTLQRGKLGETYNIGGDNQRANVDIVHQLCDILDAERPKRDGSSYRTQIMYVKDRPGHDRRYAIDATKIQSELGWYPSETLETGLQKTVRWYLNHPDWVNTVMSENYEEWIAINYGDRLANPA